MLFAGVAVAEFQRAVAWYERLFGRPADVVVADNEVMWQVTHQAWLYVVEDAARAGQALIAISVPDLESERAKLRSRDLPCGPIETVGEAGHKAVVTDPEGNSISLIQVA